MIGKNAFLKKSRCLKGISRLQFWVNDLKQFVLCFFFSSLPFCPFFHSGPQLQPMSFWSIGVACLHIIPANYMYKAKVSSFYFFNFSNAFYSFVSFLMAKKSTLPLYIAVWQHIPRLIGSLPGLSWGHVIDVYDMSIAPVQNLKACLQDFFPKKRTTN